MLHGRARLATRMLSRQGCDLPALRRRDELAKAAVIGYWNRLLGGFPDGDDTWLVVASKGGSPSHPAWFINLAKHPDQVWLEVGNRKLRVAVESLTGAQREGALARVAGGIVNSCGLAGLITRRSSGLRARL